jgi:hypothetical protein
MTEKQRTRLYFPAWHAAFEANWEHVGKTIQKRAHRAQSRWLDLVIQASRAEPLPKSCKELERQLRYAGHTVAIGLPKDSDKLTNRELDRVVTLFHLLADPDNLDAQMRWDHPEIGEEKRLIGGIAALANALGDGTPYSGDRYVRGICADKFGTRLWESGLDLNQLRMLANTLRARLDAKRAKAPKAEPQLDAANAPW